MRNDLKSCEKGCESRSVWVGGGGGGRGGLGRGKDCMVSDSEMQFIPNLGSRARETSENILFPVVLKVAFFEQRKDVCVGVSM